jgi:ornithine carbamoyltransferase
MAELRHFLDLDRTDPETLRRILDAGARMKAGGGNEAALAGRTQFSIQ